MDSLAVGCVACPGFGTTMACASCRVRWNADGGPWCASDENIWYTLHKHSDDCECGDCPERVEPDGNGWAGDGDGDGEDDGEDGEEDGEWSDEEEDGWEGGEEDGGEDDEWWGDEGGGEAEGDWGAGTWVHYGDEAEHPYGWVVDYAAGAPAAAAVAASAPALAAEEVATIAAAAARAAVEAMAASPDASASSVRVSSPVTDEDWRKRVRVLELSAELAELERGGTRARR